MAHAEPMQCTPESLHDMTSEENSRAPSESRTSEKLLRQAVEFLNRDVRSFLPASQTQEEMPTAKSPAAPVPEPLPPLVDTGKLDDLIFRREVLDWRDNFHAQVTLTTLALHKKFIKRIDAELNEVGFFRQLITRPAREVLQLPFIREVKFPLNSSLKREEEKRAARTDESAGLWKFKISFKKPWPEFECNCLGDIGFKPKNRDAILARIETLLLGDNGIAAGYREQATHIARKLIEEKQPC